MSGDNGKIVFNIGLMVQCGMTTANGASVQQMQNPIMQPVMATAQVMDRPIEVQASAPPIAHATVQGAYENYE